MRDGRKDGDHNGVGLLVTSSIFVMQDDLVFGMITFDRV